MKMKTYRPHCRVRIFLDYWNFELSMRDRDKKFNIDWKKIGQVLAQAASEAVNSPEPAEYQGLNLYGSYGLTDSGKKRKEWATKVIAIQPGVNVNMVPRQQKKNYPQCPKCHIRVRSCPKCEADMRGTQEKGVDVRMATDMIKWAVNDNYDVAVLVSSDGDFAPVAEFLATKRD